MTYPSRPPHLSEDGFQHVTARGLGPFYSTIPSVPCLLAAYGTRVSEIAKMPNVNPKGSRSDGPFADLIGRKLPGEHVSWEKTPGEEAQR